MKIVLCLAILVTPTLWADEAADKAAVEATIAALNNSPAGPDLFTADFPNAAELQRFREKPQPSTVPSFQTLGTTIRTPAGTLVISREPMGEATWYPNTASFTALPRFVTRSVAFVAPDTAVVVATYERQSALFVVKNDSNLQTKAGKSKRE